MAALSIPTVGFLYDLNEESQSDSQDRIYGSPSMRNMKSGEPSVEITTISGLIPSLGSPKSNHLLRASEASRSPMVSTLSKKLIL